MSFTHKEMQSMIEAELKLFLLRYNMLSKKESAAAYMCLQAGENMYYNTEWSRCVDEMIEISSYLRKHGYELAYADVKTAGEIEYDVYKIVHIGE